MACPRGMIASLEAEFEEEEEEEELQKIIRADQSSEDSLVEDRTTMAAIRKADRIVQNESY